MNALFDPTEQSQITCHAPDEFQEKAIGWDIDHLQMAPGNYRASLEIIHTQNIQFSNVTHHIGVQERGTIPLGTYAISLPFILDTDPLYWCGEQLEKNKCPVLQAGEEFETYSPGSVNYISIVTDADLLDREAVLLTGHPFKSLQQSHQIRIQKQDQLRLAKTILSMMQELKNYPQHLATWQQEQELLEKQLIEQLLLSTCQPSGEKIRIPTRRQVAWKAEQLIRQHPQQNLNIHQLCSLVGCSPRSLHFGFKERYGTTPIKYRRTLALNAIRHQLCHLKPGASISEIAMAWGFYHLGRFSEQYRQLFNELPRTTVKQNRK